MRETAIANKPGQVCHEARSTNEEFNMERIAESIDEAFAVAVLLLCRIVEAGRSDLVRSNGFPHLQLESGEAKAKAKAKAKGKQN